ncbi:MAG: putative holin-like toxin [Oscillospiraceae bacterium]|nr:putative holin-like toxin [Oscillospiraceae bacterium]
MSVYEALVLAIEIAALVVAILSYIRGNDDNDKRK